MIIFRTTQHSSEYELIWDHIENHTVFIRLCAYLGSYSEQHNVHQIVCLFGIIFRRAQCSSECVIIWDQIQNSTVFIQVCAYLDHIKNRTVFIRACAYLGSYSEQHSVHLSV